MDAETLSIQECERRSDELRQAKVGTAEWKYGSCIIKNYTQKPTELNSHQQELLNMSEEGEEESSSGPNKRRGLTLGLGVPLMSIGVIAAVSSTILLTTHAGTGLIGGILATLAGATLITLGETGTLGLSGSNSIQKAEAKVLHTRNLLQQKLQGATK